MARSRASSSVPVVATPRLPSVVAKPAIAHRPQPAPVQQYAQQRRLSLAHQQRFTGSRIAEADHSRCLKWIANRRDAMGRGRPQQRPQQRRKHVRVFVRVKVRHFDLRALQARKLRPGLGFHLFGAEASAGHGPQHFANRVDRSDSFPAPAVSALRSQAAAVRHPPAPRGSQR